MQEIKKNIGLYIYPNFHSVTPQALILLGIGFIPAITLNRDEHNKIINQVFLLII